MANTKTSLPFTFYLASVQKRQLTCHSPGRTAWIRKTTISPHTARKWIPFSGFIAPFVYKTSYICISLHLHLYNCKIWIGRRLVTWCHICTYLQWMQRERCVTKATVRMIDFNTLKHAWNSFKEHTNTQFLPHSKHSSIPSKYSVDQCSTEMIAVYSDNCMEAISIWEQLEVCLMLKHGHW
jgi:hypothetical protein